MKEQTKADYIKYRLDKEIESMAAKMYDLRTKLAPILHRGNDDF